MLYKSENKKDLNLYEKDYYLWLNETANFLEKGQFGEIDITNLVEEIQDMGRSEKRAVVSNLEVLLMHLLKYKYQPKKRSNSWLYTIFEHRDRLEKLFADSPSLKPYSQEVFENCYQTARKKAAVETGLEIDIFPSESTYSHEQALDFDYLPD